MKNYTVTIERESDGKRFARVILASDENDATRRAYRMLANETVGYYVVFARIA